MPKYLILLGDGMADIPVDSLAGKTPLEVASTPHMDELAREGVCGWVKTIPDSLPPGSDVANLSVLGFDPLKYYTGRAPLEAASIGVQMDPKDVVFRCNLVTIKDGCMVDYSAGHISTNEAREIIETLQQRLGNRELSFYPGVSYRHLLLWRGGEADMECIPPHDISEKEISSYLPRGEGSEIIVELMKRSKEILASHPINLKRVRNGEKPANMIWLWGQGKRPALPSFKEAYGLPGGIISAVDLMKGIAIYLGMKPICVPEVTGYLDTNYQGKAEYALRFLREEGDFVYLHIEAPDEAGHNGDVRAKIRAIEDIDSKVLAPILKVARRSGTFSIMLLCDHPTPISVRTHTRDPVPFVIWRSDRIETGSNRYCEKAFERVRSFTIKDGYRLMSSFLYPDETFEVTMEKH